MTGHAPSSPFTSDVSLSDFGSRIWDFLRFSLAREAFLLLHWAAFPISALSYPKAERPFLHVSRFTFNFCCVLLTPPTDSLGSGNRFKNMKSKEAFHLYEALKEREHAATKRRACL